eukprot:CAMPEP_0174703612 /NCGR_PEP_ID=MMETSP1094-20130205/7501_1 /TAXON_ID=156173 /ORGANISM="Chrysochromulina brevifilum, Strain UTEX LB 985" /LENGTH=34 /DNA_ID= /DNA_START= /DNA_END= /DNA_ORIENTATION=
MSCGSLVLSSRAPPFVWVEVDVAVEVEVEIVVDV